MTEDEISKLPMLLTVDQARKIIGLGKGKMYEFLRTEKDLPIIKLSPRQTRIPKEEFLKWIYNKIERNK